MFRIGAAALCVGGSLAVVALALQAQAQPSPASAVLPVGSPILVELAEPVSTKVQKTGDRFALRLPQPVTVDGKVVLPGGVTGEGEVIDLERPGPLGRPGKLVLAARFLTVDGRKVPIRALKLGSAGADRTGLILVASFVPYVGIGSLFIHGGDIELPAGTQAQVKLAADYTPAADILAPPQPAAATPPSPPPKESQ